MYIKIYLICDYIHKKKIESYKKNLLLTTAILHELAETELAETV